MISVAMGEEDYRIVRSKSEKLFFSIGHIPLNILQQETVFKTEWHRMMYKEVRHSNNGCMLSHTIIRYST